MRAFILILAFLVHENKNKSSVFLDYTFWKNKGFYSIGFEHNKKNNWGLCIKGGYGNVSKMRIGPAYHIGDQWGYSLNNPIYLPYTQNTREELNLDNINYVRNYYSNLNALYFMVNIKHMFSINKYAKPYVFLMSSFFNLKDKYTITGYRIFDNYEKNYNDVYGFLSFGISTGFGCNIIITKKLFFISGLSFCYYFPYHYRQESKYLSQYDGKSVFESGNGEFNIGLGYTISK